MNTKGDLCAVRFINCLYDVRLIRVNDLMSVATIEACVRDVFADTYSDLASYRLMMYVDKQLKFGIYNILVRGHGDVYEGALITVVPTSLQPVPLPRTSYYDRVKHMTHSRSWFIEDNRPVAARNR